VHAAGWRRILDDCYQSGERQTMTRMTASLSKALVRGVLTDAVKVVSRWGSGARDLVAVIENGGEPVERGD
jgi:hypothetical protein